jgi:hypothetical protein
MRYFGCHHAQAGSPVQPGRERKAASATGAPTAEFRFQEKLRGQAPNLLLLKVQLQSELKLSRIEGGGRAAVVTAVAGALLEEVDVVNESRSGAFIEPIK